MADKSNRSSLDVVKDSVRETNLAVFAGKGSAAATTADNGEALPPLDLPQAYDQSVAKAVQSVGQTTAIVIQDGADMLRNISTIEVTAIGAATAAWLATGLEAVYKPIIEESVKVMNESADLYLKIGQNAYTVLDQFSPE